MVGKIGINCHSSIKFNFDKTIYIDPFRIVKNLHDADVIMITHKHYDHYSPQDIEKIKKDNTKIVIPQDLLDEVQKLGFNTADILTVKPSQKYSIENINFETIPSYNTNKNFHAKENNWVGYIIEFDNIRYYIAGDTDITLENKQVKCDIALVPIGGTYTMTYDEAASLINQIKPKIVIPTHYAEIVGTTKDAEKFSDLLDKEIECVYKIKA